MKEGRGGKAAVPRRLFGRREGQRGRQAGRVWGGLIARRMMRWEEDEDTGRRS